MWGWDNLISFVGGLGATSLMFWQASGKLAEKFIDKKMAIKLKNHEAELNNLAAEKTRAHEMRLQAVNHEFDRKIHDFSLYTTKRHEIYPDYYESVLRAQSEITRRIRSTMNFRQMSDKEILGFFKTHGIKEEMVTQALAYMVNDKNKAYAELRKLESRVELSEMSRLLNESNNLLMLSELYFEDDTFEVASEINSELKMLFINKEHLAIYELDNQERISTRKENEKRSANVQSLLLELRKLMKRDLKG
ncbi:hypothetical protein [Shouchella clausii]|uniref:hypothetical protein n=1 Tax=Shouchella clausii TaxID=79880 RepID=UPI000797AC98|nr:hypothetical protein [Shouchella clausii]KKI87548.1 hypothetical protein WZ76_03445 [Shouchella clausii]